MTYLLRNEKRLCDERNKRVKEQKKKKHIKEHKKKLYTHTTHKSEISVCAFGT